MSLHTSDIKLAFDQLSGWRKILDFKSLKEDSGLYVFASQLASVEVPSPEVYVTSAPLLVAATPVEITVTRGMDGTITGYVDRSMQFTIVDHLGAGTFTEPAAFADFAVDDTATSQNEASSGELREIRIWDVALTASQIGEL